MASKRSTKRAVTQAASRLVNTAGHHGNAVVSASKISTPEQDTDFGSDTGTPSASLPARNLPDTLLNYICQTDTVLEPPRKRQRTSAVSNDSKDKEVELEHIIVKESSWNIYFSGSTLATLETPITKRNVAFYVHWDQTPEYIEIENHAKTIVYHAPLPSMDTLEDVHLALLVHRDSKKWAKTQGRLWTELDISLQYRNGHDSLQLLFIVKWATTSSPLQLHQAIVRTPALTGVLQRYFPDPAVGGVESWSPQDFYTSAHVPTKDDHIAATMKVQNLKAELYPFQKRAVRWLLQREGVEWSREGRIKGYSVPSHMELPLSFMQAQDAQGRPCFVSHLFSCVTYDIQPFVDSEQQLKGGLLAEEMGLGKTLEIIALILLHKRPEESSNVYDLYTGQACRPTKATLIISPPAILQQWISEINRHAPILKVFHYQGIREHTKHNTALEDQDVVITTYGVLSSEIYHTPLNPEKSLRNEAKYPRPKSPLMALSWWRCCIDEAQVTEGGVSNSAIVAKMIPRVNAWAISGTPVTSRKKNDLQDLRGILNFLRHEPFNSVRHVWSNLTFIHKNDFRKLFGAVSLRHSKQNVKDELRLPTQRRYIFTMPFTPVEEQHYQELFNQMCEELGVDNHGNPIMDDWVASEDAMRRWLVRLRQTILHPEVGNRNRRALGQKDGPLRTVEQVLNAMVDNTDVAIRIDQRALLMAKLKRGQLFENSPRVKEALAIWEEALKEASALVEENREHLRSERANIDAGGKSAEVTNLATIDDEDQDEVAHSHLAIHRNRLRSALEVKHVAVFFLANAIFQIKEMTSEPESDEFKALEKREKEEYDLAKEIRREVLEEIFQQADKLMKRIAKSAAGQDFVQIPDIPSSPPKGGLESRRIMEDFHAWAIALDIQANILDEWREKTIQSLLRPLVDEDDGVDLTGDEYEDSTKLQDELEVYLQVLRAVIADRHDALTGLTNALVAFDVKQALKLAKDVEGPKGPAPEKMIELLNIREQIKPGPKLGSLRGFIGQFRTLATALRADAENGSVRAQNELVIVEEQLQAAQKHLTDQMKVVTALEKEVELFNETMNNRLQYYRQLQSISDLVAPYEGLSTEAVLDKMLEDEDRLQKKIAVSRSKLRYLEHLRSEPDEQGRICVICREQFEIGALTVCGHQYCRDCIRQWWTAHRNCPVCKRKLASEDLHDVTYKPQELSIQTEHIHEHSSPSKSRKSVIYTEFSKEKLAEIKNIELPGKGSFATKVDTLARHIIWLRESDPGAKSIIFSQFSDYLGVVAQAFQKYRIGFSSIDKRRGIENFKNDPSVECFLLHARAHSSGLNLVNASHVFLCEPILNTALELQAIARVDRIGQNHETNVWLYLVDGTVEESVYQLSTARRLQHIDQRLNDGKGKGKELAPEEFLDANIDAANSLELQQAGLAGLLTKGEGGKGGEMVATEDLWDCLFGGVAQRTASRTIGESALKLDAEVGRHLRAEAADQRAAT